MKKKPTLPISTNSENNEQDDANMNEIPGYKHSPVKFIKDLILNNVPGSKILDWNFQLNSVPPADYSFEKVTDHLLMRTNFNFDVNPEKISLDFPLLNMKKSEPKIDKIKFEILEAPSTGMCAAEVDDQKPVQVCGAMTNRIATMVFLPDEKGNNWEVGFAMCDEHCRKFAAGETINISPRAGVVSSSEKNFRIRNYSENPQSR